MDPQSLTIFFIFLTSHSEFIYVMCVCVLWFSCFFGGREGGGQIKMLKLLVGKPIKTK